MNNDDVTTQKRKRISKRKVRIVAVMALFLGVLCLTACIRAYFVDDYLRPGAPLNPDLVVVVMKMIRVETFGIIPSLSVFIIGCSLFLWRLSKRLDDDKEPK
jgi:hypothetical protein